MLSIEKKIVICCVTWGARQIDTNMLCKRYCVEPDFRIPVYGYCDLVISQIYVRLASEGQILDRNHVPSRAAHTTLSTFIVSEFITV